MMLRLGLLLATLVFTFPPTVGWAQDAAASQGSGARELFQKGKAAYGVGNYESAIQNWRKAYSMDPKPLILFNIAQALERLGKLKGAVDSYKRYIDAAPAGTATYSEVTAKLATLRQRLANTGVLLEGALDGSQILVDGTSWGVTPRPDKISVTPGSHRIVLKQDGYRDYVSNVVIPAGQVITIPVEMEAEPKLGPATAAAAASTPGAPAETANASASTSAPPTEDALAEEAAAASRGPNWGWLISGGVAASASVGLMLYALERHNQVENCNRQDWYCSELEAVKGERTLGIAAGATLFLGGGAAIIYGLLSDGPEESPVAGDTRCIPGLAGGSCTLFF